MNIFNVGKIALYPLTTGHESYVSTVTVQVSGIAAASGSMVPQLRISMEGQNTTPPSWTNCTYLNQATGATVTAGTPITADGLYEFSTNGSFLAMNVTAVTGSYQLFVVPLAGPSGMSSGGSGGSSTVSGTAADNSTNSTAKLPVLPARANAADPSWTEGNQVPLSANLSGQLRIIDETPTPNTPLPTYLQNSGGTVSANVTAASTAAVATDPGLVVSLSPNANIVNNATPSISATALPVYASLAVQNSGVQQPVRTAGRVAAGDTGNSSISVGPVVLNPVSSLWDPMPGSAVAGQLVKPYAFRANEWLFACATGGLTTLTGVTMRAAAGAGIYIYCTAVQFCNSSAIATELEIRSGASGTVIWRGYAPASMTNFAAVTFPDPLVTATTNVLLEIACVTTGAAVRVSAQGYTASNA